VMDKLSFNVQNIIDGQGMPIALTGMLIVFSVLVLISLFLVVLPKILAVIAKKFPEIEGHVERVQDEDDGSVLAAIGFVLHQRRAGKG
ncbi:MAG: OadG family protein, partial [Candidatus Latescibacteria bacterium]|nr:OadG family protein [Candidatus Latescibacterota bacterium]